MAGIAGVFQIGEKQKVEQMLESISHRGEFGKEILEMENATIGIVWSQHEDERVKELTRRHIFRTCLLRPRLLHCIMPWWSCSAEAKL